MDLFTALIVIGGLGLVFGGLLAVAASHFAVEEDARVETICDLLPGASLPLKKMPAWKQSVICCPEPTVELAAFPVV